MEVTEREIRAKLAELCKAAGSQAKWAKKNGVSETLVSAILTQQRGFSKKLLKKLGYERMITYRKAGKLS